MKRLLLLLVSFTILFKLQAVNTNEYKILLEYDTINNNFKGKLFLSWQNLSNHDIYELPFHFLMDSKNSQISNATVCENKCEIKYFDKGFVLIFSKPIRPDDTTEIHIEFETKKRINYLDLGMGDYLLPTIQYFDKNLFNPDYQVHSNYIVNIKVPNGYEIVTTGKITKKVNGDDAFINVQTEARDVPRYGIIISKNFKVKETSTKSGILIRSVYLEGEEYWAEKIMNYAKDVIEFYIDTLGFYPQDQISLIPGETGSASGGWPIFPNIVGIHRGGLKQNNADTHVRWIIAHEIGHQYWGFNYILDPTNYPQWFGISMGLYTDRLYVTSKKIDQSYDFWFQYYLEGLKSGYNTTVMQSVDTLDKQNFNWNGIIMHSKSFVILRMLAKEVGEDRFYDIFQYCLQNYKGVNVTLDLFQKTCEKITKRDLEWFFNQWYRTNYYLDYQIKLVESKRKGDKYQTICIINRKGKAYMSSVDVALEISDSTIIFKNIDGKQKDIKITIDSDKDIVKIVIDPKNELPLINRKEWIRTN